LKTALCATRPSFDAVTGICRPLVGRRGADHPLQLMERFGCAVVKAYSLANRSGEHALRQAA